MPSFPLDEVGTDPRQAVNFATREITLDGTTQPLGAWVKLVTDKIVASTPPTRRTRRGRS